MKIIVRCLAALLALVALAAAGLGIYIAQRYYRELPVLVEVSPLARQRVAELFAAAQRGDYAAAEATILGQPSLGIDRSAKEPLAAAVWDAYQSSLKFEAKSDFYATETGLAIDYKVTKLDIDGVMEPVAARAEDIMQQRIQEAQRVEEIYDSNNEYREDFVQRSIELAVEAALQEDTHYFQSEFTVSLVYQDGTWWAIGDDALMQALAPDFGG